MGIEVAVAVNHSFLLRSEQMFSSDVVSSVVVAGLDGLGLGVYL